jgi:hypothetical protein
MDLAIVFGFLVISIYYPWLEYSQSAVWYLLRYDTGLRCLSGPVKVMREGVLLELGIFTQNRLCLRLDRRARHGILTNKCADDGAIAFSCKLSKARLSVA